MEQTMKQSREHQLIPTIADTLPESYVRDYFPTASSLLDLWRCPWSDRYLRFASYALHRVKRRIGIDVLDAPR